MAILKTNKFSPTTHYGWYGKCEETDCTQEFELSTNSKILRVYTTQNGVPKNIQIW